MRVQARPLTISTGRLLLLPLTMKSFSSGDQSGARAPASVVSTLRVRVSPNATWSRSIQARTCACAAKLAANSSRQASDVYQRGISRSEEHTSDLQSLMRISYAVFCLKKKHNQH